MKRIVEQKPKETLIGVDEIDECRYFGCCNKDTGIKYILKSYSCSGWRWIDVKDVGCHQAEIYTYSSIKNSIKAVTLSPAWNVYQFDTFEELAKWAIS